MITGKAMKDGGGAFVSRSCREKSKKATSRRKPSVCEPSSPTYSETSAKENIEAVRRDFDDKQTRMPHGASDSFGSRGSSPAGSSPERNGAIELAYETQATSRYPDTTIANPFALPPSAYQHAWQHVPPSPGTHHHQQHHGGSYYYYEEHHPISNSPRGSRPVAPQRHPPHLMGCDPHQGPPQQYMHSPTSRYYPPPPHHVAHQPQQHPHHMMPYHPPPGAPPFGIYSQVPQPTYYYQPGYHQLPPHHLPPATVPVYPAAADQHQRLAPSRRPIKRKLSTDMQEQDASPKRTVTADSQDILLCHAALFTSAPRSSTNNSNKRPSRRTQEPALPKQQEDDFLRHRMTDRDLLRHFYNYYHTKEMSLRAYTNQQHIGRSQFMRRWKELDVSSFKDQGVPFGEDDVLQDRVVRFFLQRQQRVVKHSTGGCKSFLTTDEEETFLATMSEKSGNGSDESGITKELFLPTIKDIIQKDIPQDLVDFVSRAVVDSLWERKLSGIKRLSELKASKRLAAKIKENRLQIGSIHTKQREIKVTKEFLAKLYAYMEKKQGSYWTIVQSSEADDDTASYVTNSATSNKMLDTSKEELFLMARLFFEEDAFKEIKLGKPWVDLLRLRVRTQITEQGVVMTKHLFDGKVRELEMSVTAKETDLKNMKEKLSSSG